MLAVDLHHRFARFGFPQDAQNLLFAVTSLAHFLVSFLFKGPRKIAISQLQNGLVLGFSVKEQRSGF
jgi:hypothetical protein